MMEVVSVIMRAFEIQKLSNRTMHLGKVLFSSIFNVFYITAITNLFREDDYEEINPSKGIQNGKTKLTKLEVMKNSKENYDVLDYRNQHRLYPKLKNNMNITENIEMNEIPIPKYATLKPHDYSAIDIEKGIRA